MKKDTEIFMNQQGNAMIISLLVLLVLSAVGLGYVMQSKTETQIAGNDMRWSQALYSSEAGVSEGLLRMIDAADTANYIGEPSGTETVGWGAYVVESTGSASGDPDYAAAESDGLDNDGDASIDESGEAYPEFATKQSTGGIPYSWVRVEYVTESGSIVRFGDHDSDGTTAQQYNTAIGEPVLRITSEGTRGNALRRIQVEAVKATPDLVDAAIYTEDDDFKFNGTQFEISGGDHDPITGLEIVGGTEVPGIATTMDPNNIANALSNNQENNVNGSGAEPSVSTSPLDLDLDALFSTYASMADRVLAGGTYSNQVWGDYDNYEVVHVTGDLHVSGSLSGGGVLIIDGDYDCTGQMIWYGLIIVLGDIKFSGGGSGTHLYGSVLVEGGVTSQTVGGNADIFYSSEALSRLAGLANYQTVSWIEL